MKIRKYCATRRVLYFFFIKDVFVDLYARFFYKPRLKKLSNNTTPQFLFFNSGHLGDALLMSYCFPEIKKKYPDAIIDVVCGEWCTFIFETNPLVRNTIIQNHFYTNRKAISAFQKLIIYFKTTILATKKLKKEVYDYSIDVRYSGGVSHWILPFINVKKSIGFGTRGYGGLLENEFFLPDSHFHNFDMTAMLLHEIGIRTSAKEISPYLPFHSENIEKIKKKVSISEKTVLLFPESGGEIKMFEHDFWVEITKNLLQKSNLTVLLCGEKPYTEALFQKLLKVFPDEAERIFSTGKLSLSEVATLPQIAHSAIVLDSFPAHLCTIFCKTLVFSKHASGYEFFPLNNTEISIWHNNTGSKNMSLARPNFKSYYLEDFAQIDIENCLKTLIQ